MSLLCWLFSGLFVAGLLSLVAGIFAILYAIRGPCRPGVSLSPDGYLVVSFGWCGELRIPIGSIKSVRRVEDPGKGFRLVGITLPGLRTGDYRFKELGSVRVYADKLRDLLLIETTSGDKFLLGFGAVGLLNELEELAGSGPQGSVEIKTRGSQMALAGILLTILGLVVLLLAYPRMAAYSVFLGSRVDKADLLVMGLVIGLIGMLDPVLLYGLGSDNPLVPLVIPFSGLGTLLVEASIALAGILCPA